MKTAAAWPRAVLYICVCALVWAQPALAQWNPAQGQWGKTDQADIRVMTWNVRDTICSTNPKVDDGTGQSLNNWNAVARIIASMQPDVLILQECGDNTGNGTGTGVDSVANLTTTIQLLFHGGNDPFRGNVPVTSYVRRYAPDFDMPYIFVTSATDNFNRNVILSRYPFADLNGDTRAVYDDIPFIIADQWAVGGRGGIRGFQFVEIDLPDAIYAGDLVVGGAHLKSGSSSSDHTDRVNAARNVSYYVQYLYNGNGTSTPDPNGRILDNPPATSVLSPLTPVILGGDFNEDENVTPAERGPVSYLAAGGMIGGMDGTDRDMTDCLYDDSRDPFNPAVRATLSSSKLDYLIWQDSIATLRRSFQFNSATANVGGGTPPELIGYPNLSLASSMASDHRPVIGDFILPLVPSDPPPGDFVLLSPANGAVALDAANLMCTWEASAGAQTYRLIVSDDPGLGAPVADIPGLTQTSHVLTSSLEPCGTYWWSVTASNVAGDTQASNGPWSFTIRARADLSGSADPSDPAYGVPDGVVDAADFFYFLDQFISGNLAVADLTGSADPSDPSYGVPDGVIDASDFFFYLDGFIAGCP
ncbi:MAG: hypothetical protein KIT24_06615 [Phycisphaeraceae bacterium]|nr:hypothetical protein [Phycisphaeraceae bacterium]